MRLKEQSIELSKKIEYNKIYDGFINGVYLLDYKKHSSLLISINKEDFFNYAYIGENTERTELNNINVYETWISYY